MRPIDADKLIELYANTLDCNIDNCHVSIPVIRQNILDMPTVNPYEWISVEDRLPKQKVNCIVYYKHAYCDDEYWAIGVSFYDGNEFHIGLAYKVTHWMPLPTPPTEKDN